MILDRHAREFYTLAITTTPAVSSWDASFDGGTSWVTGSAGTVDGVPVVQWLLAGPAAPAGAPAGTTVAATVNPLIRATAAPETVVRKAPPVTVT